MRNIKLIIFDLDGCLIDSREYHFLSLNQALSEIDPKFVISKKDHLARFDGLPTKEKLLLLTKERGLPQTKYDKIWNRKQYLTTDIIEKETFEDSKLIELFKQLKSDNIKIYVCSNSIKNTVELVLKQKGILSFVDGFYSNEDVVSPKPHPEMYWMAMTKEKMLPEETIIVEDSYVGRKAAISSGAKLCAVKNPDEVTLEKIYEEMEKPIRKHKWVDKKMNVLIPMAGLGSRFKEAGYSFPKPLIEVRNKPMIQAVVENLNVDANFIFLVQREHYQTYHLESMLNVMTPKCKIILVDGLTEGAACTTLLAKHLIDNDEPLLIANSDQLIEWESGEFFHAMNSPNIDAGIVTFNNSHPKWSYVRLDDYGNIVETKEKEVISDIATVGIYYFSKGSDYVRGAEQMISKNIRVNNEFYVCPIFNELIEEGKKVKNFNIEKMWGIGTPSDLEYFLNNYEKDL